MYSSQSIPKDIQFPQVYHQICKALPEEFFNQAWLVGGAIRSIMLNQPLDDLDFIVQDNAILCARTVADRLGADYFTLDDKRGVGRILLRDNARTAVDISCMHSDGIEADMLNRDFTINAIAMRCYNPQELVDPTEGLKHIRQKKIRMVSKNSFSDDPIRLIRAIRIAVQTDFIIEPNTSIAIRKHIAKLQQVSTERIRDEFMRCLSSKAPHKAVHLLSHLDMMKYILADWNDTVGQEALSKLRTLESLVSIIFARKTRDAACEYTLGLFASTVGQFRPELEQYLSGEMVITRQRYQLMYLTILLRALAVSSEHRKTVDILRLSKTECKMISLMMPVVDLPETLSTPEDSLIRKQYSTTINLIPPNKARAIHKFFRTHSTIAIEIGLLALAEIISKYGPQIPHDLWERKLAAMFVLLDGYFDRYDQLINPRTIIDGNDLIQELGYKPGAKLGTILQQISEAQAAGELRDRDSALKMARRLYSTSNK
jgi:tRNA nucleotidyltransferase/poly(A) polymerase